MANPPHRPKGSVGKNRNFEVGFSRIAFNPEVADEFRSEVVISRTDNTSLMREMLQLYRAHRESLRKEASPVTKPEYESVPLPIESYKTLPSPAPESEPIQGPKTQYPEIVPPPAPEKEEKPDLISVGFLVAAKRLGKQIELLPTQKVALGEIFGMAKSVCGDDTPFRTYMHWCREFLATPESDNNPTTMLLRLHRYALSTPSPEDSSIEPDVVLAEFSLL